MQVYWDHLCQDNSSDGRGSSPCVIFPVHCKKSHVSPFASGSQWHNCGCWLYKQEIEAICPWVDLINSVHHIKILSIMSQALGWLPSKGDMVEREVFTKKN